MAPGLPVCLKSLYFNVFHGFSEGCECNTIITCVALTDGPESDPLCDLIFAENLHAPGGGIFAERYDRDRRMAGFVQNREGKM